VLRRLLSAIPTLAAVATLVFSLIHLIPGDPVLIMLGEGAQPVDLGAGGFARGGASSRWGR